MKEELGFPREAIYNQAGFQMLRIHEIESRINEHFVSPLKYDIESQCFNYQKMLADFDNLLNIVDSKLSEKERESIDKLRKGLKKFQEDNPIYEELNRDGRSFRVFKRKNWDILSELIYDYRRNLSRLMDAHGLGNPDKKNAGVSIIN